MGNLDNYLQKMRFESQSLDQKVRFEVQNQGYQTMSWFCLVGGYLVCSNSRWIDVFMERENHSSVNERYFK